MQKTSELKSLHENQLQESRQKHEYLISQNEEHIKKTFQKEQESLQAQKTEQ